MPCPGAVALGTVVFLTEGQLRVLDRYEGRPNVYDRQNMSAQVFRDGVWSEMSVVAYIKQVRGPGAWYSPSEAYRCAVLRNVRGSFPGVQSLLLRDLECNTHEEWKHPGFAGLGLGAFLFEVG